MKQVHTHYDLKIDDEFQRLTPPLSPEDYTKLEQKITMYGCCEPLIVWQGKLLTGFAEYKICQRLNIPFYVEYSACSTREEAVSHICRNSLSRAGIPKAYTRYCIGKLYTAQLVLMEHHMHDTTINGNSSDSPVSRLSPKTYVSEMIAREYHIHPRTPYKYALYSSAIDTINRTNHSIALELLNGSFHLSQDNIIELSKLSGEEMRIVRNHMLANNDTRILNSSCIRTRQRERSSTLRTLEKKPLLDTAPEIKQMPKYDPDAELSSLSLTIPMWISSLNRSSSMANFREASPEAIKKLSSALSVLADTIKALEETIKENTL